MSFYLNKLRAYLLKTTAVVVGVFMMTSFCLAAQPAQTASALDLPLPGTRVLTSNAYEPALLKGMVIHPDDPLAFDFVVDPGQDGLTGEDLNVEGLKLIKYFLAALTIPDDEMWVNLSPYEENRIMTEALSQTLLGRELLAQDYILKQLASSLMYPEEPVGRDFWQKVHETAQDQLGHTNIPVNTFNKIWIVPDQARVYVEDTQVYVVHSTLKVLTEEDFLALRNNQGHTRHGVGQKPADSHPEVTDISTDVLREVILPVIEKEINEGETFAPLRQVVHSMILATWYKNNLRSSFLSQVYVDQNKTDGVTAEDRNVKEKVYRQYLAAFQRGVYNYIREDFDPVSQATIPRKYFSGGILGLQRTRVDDTATRRPDFEGDEAMLNVQLRSPRDIYPARLFLDPESAPSLNFKRPVDLPAIDAFIQKLTGEDTRGAAGDQFDVYAEKEGIVVSEDGTRFIFTVSRNHFKDKLSRYRFRLKDASQNHVATIEVSLKWDINVVEGDVQFTPDLSRLTGGEMVAFYVEEAYRKGGMGKFLLHLAQRFAALNGMETMLIHADRTAERFYLENNFYEDLESDSFPKKQYLRALDLSRIQVEGFTVPEAARRSLGLAGQDPQMLRAAAILDDIARDRQHVWPVARVSAAFISRNTEEAPVVATATNTVGIHTHAEVMLILGLLNDRIGRMEDGERQADLQEKINRLVYLVFVELKIPNKNEAKDLLTELLAATQNPFEDGTFFINAQPCKACAMTLSQLNLGEVQYKKHQNPTTVEKSNGVLALLREQGVRLRELPDDELTSGGNALYAEIIQKDPQALEDMQVQIHGMWQGYLSAIFQQKGPGVNAIDLLRYSREVYLSLVDEFFGTAETSDEYIEKLRDKEGFQVFMQTRLDLPSILDSFKEVDIRMLQSPYHVMELSAQSGSSSSRLVPYTLQFRRIRDANLRKRLSGRESIVVGDPARLQPGDPKQLTEYLSSQDNATDIIQRLVQLLDAKQSREMGLDGSQIILGWEEGALLAAYAARNPQQGIVSVSSVSVPSQKNKPQAGQNFTIVKGQTDDVLQVAPEHTFSEMIYYPEGDYLIKAYRALSEGTAMVDLLRDDGRLLLLPHRRISPDEVQTKYQDIAPVLTWISPGNEFETALQWLDELPSAEELFTENQIVVFETVKENDDNARVRLIYNGRLIQVYINNQLSGFVTLYKDGEGLRVDDFHPLLYMKEKEGKGYGYTVVEMIARLADQYGTSLSSLATNDKVISQFRQFFEILSSQLESVPSEIFGRQTRFSGALVNADSLVTGFKVRRPVMPPAWHTVFQEQFRGQTYLSFRVAEALRKESLSAEQNAFRKGGIDLNPQNMDLAVDGNEVNWDASELNTDLLLEKPITGFEPVILRVVPFVNALPLVSRTIPAN